MNFKKIAVLTAVTFVLIFVGLMIHGGRTAQAAGPWYVSPTGSDGNDCLSAATACLTIQAAVIKASSGDTINVAPGTYAVVGANLNKALTLNGAQAGVDARDGRPAAMESIIAGSGFGTFHLSAANITFDGFKFSNLKGRELDSTTHADNFTMRNCILEGSSIDPGYNTGAIQFGGGLNLHANGLVFEQNLVTADNGQLFYMGHAMDSGTIRNNIFHGDTVSFGPFGSRTGWLIEGNEFDGDVPGHGPYWGFGFNANLGDVIIRYNNVHKMFVGLGQFSVVGGSIIANTFNDNQFAAFQLWGGEFGSVVSTNVTVDCNVIKYNGTVGDGTPPNASHGIRLRVGLDASTIHLHNNNFTNLGADVGWAIRQNGTGTADAKSNWWGTTNPITIASMFGEGAVDFSSWLSGPSLCAPGLNVIFVNSVPSAGMFGTNVNLSSQASDTAGLTDVYYNLFTPGGVFVCNLAHVSISGNPTSYTDGPTLVAAPMPFAGLDTGVGGPCPAAGIAEGSYVLAANWIDSLGVQAGAPNNQVLSNYPASATFSPFIYDTTPPSVTAPGTVTLYTGPAATTCDVTVANLDATLGTATASDNLSGVTVTRSGVPFGNVFPKGMTTVTYTATDGAGNMASSDQTVIVVDNTPPVISCPSPITVDATSAAGATVTYATPVATDNCGNPVPVNCVAPSGSTFAIGTTAVTCTATDTSGVQAFCMFNVTVRTPYATKQNVRAAIALLRAAATDKKDQDKLDDALSHMDKSLNPAWWTDPSHPAEKDGEKVFNEEKEVVKKLAELIKDKKSMNPTDMQLMDLIARIVQVDRVLALISISEQTDPKKVAKALDEIAKGDAERDNSKPDHADNAIDHYKNAWKKT